MDEEMEGVNETQEKKQGGGVVEKGKELANNVQETKKTLDKLKNAEKVGKVASKSKFLTALGPILPYIGIALLIILLIIFIIGIVVFVLTMPGMVMEQLKAMFHELGNKVASFFGADETKMIENEEIYEVLDYLEDMGYDLKGYGFLTEFFDESDIENDTDVIASTDSSSITKEDFWASAVAEFGEKGEADNGVIRGKDSGKIIGANSDFILYYIMSDNYVYTVKNFNITNEAANRGGFWNTVWGGIVALGQKFVGIFADEGALWGKGMIYLVDPKGDEWSNGINWDSWTWDTIKVDASAKVLKIKRGAFANSFEFSLDGWTGRYGMPIDFLLSVHLATNMPDLAYDMVNMFGTEVTIKMAEAEADADAAYKDPVTSKFVGYDEMYEAKSAGWSPTDGWTLSKEEAYNVLKLGITSPEGCTYQAPTFLLIDATDNGDGWIFDPNNLEELKQYGFTDEELNNLDLEMQQSIAVETDEKFKSKEAMIKVVDETSIGTKSDEAKSYGYDYTTCKNAGGYNIYTDTINGKSAIVGTCSCTETHKLTEIASNSSKTDYVQCDYHKITVRGGSVKPYCLANTFYKIKKSVITREWQASFDGGTEDATYQWVSYVYKVYSYTNSERTEGEKYIETYLVDYILREYTVQELIDAKILNPDGTTKSENTCSDAAHNNLEGVTACCETCRKHVKKIINSSNDADTENMPTYTPYITQVTDHWYRNVYFEVDSKKEVINIDEEYEMLMKERWTVYETDDTTGLTVWYIVNDDGTLGDKYEGTKEDADEKGIAVARKAKTSQVKASVYKEKTTADQGEWERAFPDTTDEIKENIYVKVTITGGKEQVEDGYRGVTNEKIKRIFATNYYFKYDGNQETADIIYALRRKVGSSSDPHYGNLNGDTGTTAGDAKTLKENLTKSVKLTVGNNDTEETYYVKDYASRVDLTKDSLSAFSMLENTHTEDADYIYKDFKELIVELGYFDKEELAENVPEIFQWFIPEIGSYGYPNRAVDKRENMYGTLAHSYDDYKAFESVSLKAQQEEREAAEAEVGDGGFIGSVDSVEVSEKDANDLNRNKNTQTVEMIDGGLDSGSGGIVDEPVSGFQSVGNSNTDNTSAINLDNVSSANTQTVKGVTSSGTIERISEDGDGYHYKVKVGNVTYTHFYQFEGSYKDNPFVVGYDPDEPNTIHTEGCGPTSSCNILTGYGNDITPADTAGFLGSLGTNSNLVKIFENWGVGAEWIDGKTEAQYLTLMEQAVSEGKPFIVLMNNGNDGFWTSGGHFVGVVGVDSSGNMITVDSGSSRAERHTYSGGLAGAAQTVKGILIPDEAPTGASTGTPYEGYKGGEAVVSPATGILLEYGEYPVVDPETVASTEEDEENDNERLNYDLMYPYNGLTGVGMATEETKDDEGKVVSTEVQMESRKVYDSVGYAKILVLDDEYYLKLEEHLKQSYSLSASETVSSLMNEDGDYLNVTKLTVEELKDWTEEKITLYGYKEFAERYNAFDLGGYVIYIDGFECELPNPEYNPEEGTGDPSGTELSMEYFKEHADDYEESLYEPDTIYQLSSIDTTARLKAEEEVKTNTKPIVVTEDGTVFIKEGTVIGRTRTDKEVVEARGDTYKDPSELGEDETQEIVGNYIRIIMRDTSDQVVENVEDYLKLDDGGAQMMDLDMEKFLYWMGIYVEGGVLDSTGTQSVAKVLGSGDNHYTHYFGLTECVAGLYAELGYGSWSTAAGQTLPLESLANTFIALIEQQKTQIRNELGDDIDDGYLQAFISVLHNYGNLTESRKSEYLAKKCVSETTWTTYNGRFAEALRKRRKSEYKIISEGRYTECYSDPDKDLEFSSETPFTDWCKEHGITNLTLKSTE